MDDLPREIILMTISNNMLSIMPSKAERMKYKALRLYYRRRISKDWTLYYGIYSKHYNEQFFSYLKYSNKELLGQVEIGENRNGLK